MNVLARKNQIKAISRILIFLAAVLLTIAIFVPMWRIELSAPQYPEGLFLQIFTHKLGGNVDIINGLNHYIGMKTLHTEDFVEFKVLPYIIGVFALFSLITSIVARKKLLYALFALFVVFGIVAMVDFWRWEYNYGHHLDPTAAIIVPGMAYQPPLIGFKQLLNFGAYSIPDKGGWMFIASGLLMLTSVIIEFREGKKKLKAYTATVIFALTSLGLQGCTPVGPEPIRVNRDQCSYCKMSISDIRFVVEAITVKGKVYKFDDVHCMNTMIGEQHPAFERFYAVDFLPPHELIAVDKLTFIHGSGIQSPMGGNTAAFTDKNAATGNLDKYSAQLITWNELLSTPE